MQHATFARPPYIYLPTTLNISADDILDFQTSEHSHLKSSQLIAVVQLMSETRIRQDTKGLFSDFKGILKTLSFLFFGQSIVSISGL